MFDAAPEKVHVIPNGVESIFFQSRNPNSKGDYLVCTASIHPRKRVLELVQAAVQSKVRVWIIGKPYSETEDYYLSFLNVQKNNQDLILYEGGIADRVRLAKIYREARGFVLLSTMESLSLSALEAAASQCPLLLSDLPWSRECFGREASYLSAETMSHDPTKLRGFYEDCLTLPAPNIRIYTWDEVASQLIACYQSILKPAHK
jgi:glycosyltransferase involved in cell wall biosynthesis